jgi:antirestriction protein ArdC
MPQRPGIQTHAGGALYRPSVDTVFMPDTRLFTSTEGYYATLFHELGHATGHASRLNRQGLTTSAAFGSETYSKEELVAEMCSSFVCGHAGIDCAVLDNAAAYIASWLKILKGDRRLVVQAAQAAQKAADCILGTKFEPAAE